MSIVLSFISYHNFNTKLTVMTLGTWPCDSDSPILPKSLFYNKYFITFVDTVGLKHVWRLNESFVGTRWYRASVCLVWSRHRNQTINGIIIYVFTAVGYCVISTSCNLYIYVCRTWGGGGGSQCGRWLHITCCQKLVEVSDVVWLWYWGISLLLCPYVSKYVCISAVRSVKVSC